MRAAYIEETGPPEVIKVGDLPRPEPGPGQVLVRVHAAALNPIDLYIRSGLVAMPLSFPYVIGCDLAGTVDEGRPRLHAFPVPGTASGARTRGCSAARARRPSTRPSTKAGSTRRPRFCRTPRPRRWPWSASRPTSACSVRPAQSRRSRLRPGRHRRRRLDGRPDGQGGRGPGRHLRRQPREARAVPAASGPISPSTTRPTTSPPGSASSHPKASTSGTKPSASRTSRSPSPCSASTAG